MRILFNGDFTENEKEYVKQRLIDINMKEEEGLSVGMVTFTFQFVDNQYVVERVSKVL